MCFSQFASYEPRPVKKTSGYNKKVSKMEHDNNYFGPKYYSDPIKEVGDAKAHSHSIEEEEEEEVTNNINQENVGGSIITLSNGHRLLVVPLD